MPKLAAALGQPVIACYAFVRNIRVADATECPADYDRSNYYFGEARSPNGHNYSPICASRGLIGLYRKLAIGSSSGVAEASIHA